ncbi:MAG: DNA-processing protein DprA [Paracoccaceae bacterium]
MQGRLTLEARPRAVPEDPVPALRLARSRNVGPATWMRLVARYGDAARALEALPELASRGGARGFRPCPKEQAEAELEAGAAAGARLLVLGGPGYPPQLAQIPDPPPVLWVRGRLEALGRPAAAIVGGRNASALGLRLAQRMAEDLGAAGVLVVSGLARGVDGAAHRGALETGTVAAVAGGVDHVYPAEHADLAERILATGAIVSEAPPGFEPQARHFPRRNRVIAGLSRAVVLVEAAARSGSLITAEFALEQGREVLAAPGSPLDPRSEGGNGLIRQGATLARGAADVLEAMGGAATFAARRPAPDEGAAEGLAETGPAFRPAVAGSDAALRAEVARLLGLEPVEEDVLARLCGAPLAALADVLLELELAGRLDRRPGGFLSLLPE